MRKLWTVIHLEKRVWFVVGSNWMQVATVNRWGIWQLQNMSSRVGKEAAVKRW